MLQRKELEKHITQLEEVLTLLKQQWAEWTLKLKEAHKNAKAEGVIEASDRLSQIQTDISDINGLIKDYQYLLEKMS